MSQDIDDVFENAITTMNLLSSRTKHSALPRPPPELRAILYGLYKQATEGDVIKLLSRPVGVSAEDLDAQSKWDIWNAYQGVSPEFAKREYIFRLIESMKISGVRESSDTSTVELLNQLQAMYTSIKHIKVEKFKRQSTASEINNLADSQSISSPTAGKTETQIITSFDGRDTTPIDLASFRSDNRYSSSSQSAEPKAAISVVAVPNSKISNNDLSKEFQLLQQKFSAEISSLNREIQILKTSNNGKGNNFNNIADYHPVRGNTEDSNFLSSNAIFARRGNNVNRIRQSFYDFENQSAISSSTYRYKILKPGEADQTKTLPYSKETISSRNLRQSESATKTNADVSQLDHIRRFLHSADDLTTSLCRKISLNFGMTVQCKSNDDKKQTRISFFKPIFHIFENCCQVFRKYKYIFKSVGSGLTKIFKKLALNFFLAVFVLKITNKRVRFVKRNKQVVLTLEDGDILDLLKERLFSYLH